MFDFFFLKNWKQANPKAHKSTFLFFLYIYYYISSRLFAHSCLSSRGGSEWRLSFVTADKQNHEIKGNQSCFLKWDKSGSIINTRIKTEHIKIYICLIYWNLQKLFFLTEMDEMFVLLVVPAQRMNAFIYLALEVLEEEMLIIAHLFIWHFSMGMWGIKKCNEINIYFSQ